ncbi:MAG: hypothetical protein JHD02_10030 [Thermoleophilaceae bacterium]|nr:hypothetical protein [Thermoleophilaceae bacterium]
MRQNKVPLGARHIAFIVALGIALSFSATAHASVKASTVVSSTGGTATLRVTLTNSKSLPSKQRPRSVSVKAAGRTLKLKKFGKGTTKPYSSGWQSSNYSGAFAQKLAALNGKRVRIVTEARNGSNSFRSKVVVQTGGGAVGGGPLFPAPGRDMVGEEAFNSIKGFFFNSAFSDCAAGPWPLCGVEQRYVHCPNFTWLYQRTSGTGADIDSRYQAMVIQGAEYKADGSWAVQYDIPSSPATYIWRVTPTGIANGEYYYNGSMTPLGPMVWSQPAITWNNTSGAC